MKEEAWMKNYLVWGVLGEELKEELQMKEKHEFVADENESSQDDYCFCRLGHCHCKMAFADDSKRLIDYTEIEYNEDDGIYTVTYVMEDGFKHIFSTDDRDKAYKAYNSPNKRLFYDED